MRILVVEDDRSVASFVAFALKAELHGVDMAMTGEEALFMAETIDFDLVILDLVLPGIHGFEVLSRLRGQGKYVPIIIVSGLATVEDREAGLDRGADDYLAKPFSIRELMARVRVLLRRAAMTRSSVLQVADLEMDRLRHAVRRGGKTVELTPKEFALLEYLMRNVGRPLTRAMIIEHVWDLSFESGTNVVDVYINYLRNKLDKGFGRKLIQTIRGVGYQMNIG